ncbi:MAG TPA: SPOR domain-containing protein [Steroidobacteraceae bacterium]|nr:SPOR domain-containing protein [Steroidobacteraceae bacterium]
MNRARQPLGARDFKNASRGGGGLPLHYRTFGAGLGAGLLVALAVFVIDRRHAPAIEARPEPKSNVARRDAGDETPTATDPAAQYDFYSMLPKFEMEVPQKGKPAPRDTSQADVEQPGAYVLQVGSYRNRDEAERVRSKVEKLGIEAKVQHVSIDADELHRVLVGPIRDLPRLNATRRELRAANFDVLMQRVGD